MKNVNKYETFVINSPVQGEIVPLTRVNDQTFSKKMIGDGFAVKPTDNNFYSPIDGRIILADRHAICIESANGTQVLIHIGIDSIKLPEELKTFVHFKRVGDIVKKGDKLIYANLEDFPANNLDSITPVIILNESIKGHKYSFTKQGKVTPKTEMITIDFVDQYVDDELLAKDEFISSRSELINNLRTKLRLNSVIYINSPVKGEIIPLSKVKDETFSQKMMGDGFAVKPSDQIFYAPIDGKIILANNHAVGIETKDGIQILIHIGIDTTTLDPKLKTFTHYVKVGDKVKQGDKLVKANLNTITKNKLSTVTPVIILKESFADQGLIKFIGSGKVSPSTSVISIDNKQSTASSKKQKLVKEEKPQTKPKKQKLVKEEKPTKPKKQKLVKEEKPVELKEKVKKIAKKAYLTFIQFCKKHKVAMLIWYIIWVVIIVAIFGIIYSVENPNLPV